VAAAPATAPPGGPHHVGAGNTTSPRRRNQVPQPPVLTTSLSGLQYPGGGFVSAGPTPSTSLSSPFSQANPSPFTSYTPSPGGAHRGTSPMAARLSGGYTTAYNPQEWGPVTGSPQVGAAPFPQVQHGGQVRQQHHSDGQSHSFSLFSCTMYNPLEESAQLLTSFSRVSGTTSVFAPSTRSNIKTRVKHRRLTCRDYLPWTVSI
jgi:hypothetical protein